MMKNSRLVEELEARQLRAERGATYEQALAVFVALWNEARALRPDFGDNWREDIKADIAVARALNGLPPAP